MRIRDAEIQDIDQLVILMNSNYIRKKTPNYFLWQFFSSPTETRLSVIEENSQIIAMLGMQKKEFKNGKNGLQIIDMLISINYRGKGLFSKLIDFNKNNFDHYDFVFVLPNSNGARALGKLGWVNLMKIDEMILDINNFRFDEIIECLTDKNSCDYDYEILYSSDFEEWRFIKEPDNNYFYKFVTKNDYTILKTFKDHNNGSVYGDIVYIKCQQCSLEKLLKETILLFKKLGVRTISMWALPHTSEYRTIRRAGFEKESRERYLCVLPITNCCDNLLNISAWKLFQSDTEMY